VNLAGIEVGEIARGMTLAAPGRFAPSTRVDSRITLLPTARKLKGRARVHFHQGTAEITAVAALLDCDELAPGESALAQIRLAEPLLLLPGDRFILRQFSPVITIGGGVVLANFASRHKRGDAAALHALEIFERGNREEVLAEMAASEPAGLSLSSIVARTGWREADARESVAALAAAGKLVAVNQEPLVVAAGEIVAGSVARLREEIEKFHKANPLVEGIPKEDLRGRVAGRRPGGAEVFRAALDALVLKGEVLLAGDLVKRAGREITLQPEEARAKEEIERAFERAGLAVPATKEVLARLPVEPKRAQKLLQLLVREQVLVKVTEDLIFHRSAMARLRGLLAAYKRDRSERLPIAAFKELTGVSRKYAIPLLEYLDRAGVTRRAGDERVIL
jgi:selenocysteine-specific elongation factor